MQTKSYLDGRQFAVSLYRPFRLGRLKANLYIGNLTNLNWFSLVD